MNRGLFRILIVIVVAGVLLFRRCEKAGPPDSTFPDITTLHDFPVPRGHHLPTDDANQCSH
jgi:hypothetical protein